MNSWLGGRLYKRLPDTGTSGCLWLKMTLWAVVKVGRNSNIPFPNFVWNRCRIKFYAGGGWSVATFWFGSELWSRRPKIPKITRVRVEMSKVGDLRAVISKRAWPRRAKFGFPNRGQLGLRDHELCFNNWLQITAQWNWKEMRIVRLHTLGILRVQITELFN